MAIFTITVDDPHGVDLKYLLPGDTSIAWFQSITSSSTGDSSFHAVVNGVEQAGIVYNTAWTGEAGSFEPGYTAYHGIAGTMLSATLSQSVSGAPFEQLAHLSIVLGSVTGPTGGIPVSGTLALTPDSLMRYAHQNDADKATLNLIGNAGNDTLHGSSYNDTINGNGGSDLMIGRDGDDRYFVDRATDVIVEAGGHDTVIATAHYVLQAGVSVEWMRTTGSSSTYNVNLTGNSAANLIQGNAGINRLDGGTNSDTLYGYDGNDVLTGGLGRDFMSGGDDADRFDFNSVSEIGKSTTRDVIKDFQHGTDHIDLATIDARTTVGGNQAFTFLASNGADFTGDAGQLHWFQQNVSGTSRDKTIIEGDINGDAHADFQIQLTGLKTLTSTDFFL